MYKNAHENLYYANKIRMKICTIHIKCTRNDATVKQEISVATF